MQRSLCATPPGICPPVQEMMQGLRTLSLLLLALALGQPAGGEAAASGAASNKSDAELLLAFKVCVALLLRGGASEWGVGTSVACSRSRSAARYWPAALKQCEQPSRCLPSRCPLCVCRPAFLTAMPC